VFPGAPHAGIEIRPSGITVERWIAAAVRLVRISTGIGVGVVVGVAEAVAVIGTV